MDDRGNGGKTLQGTYGSLSSRTLLAIEVMPVNDPPVLLTPRVDKSTPSVTFTADEDRLGIVGVDDFGLPQKNILGATTISNSSILLSDADVTYDSDDTTLHQASGRWVLAREDGVESPSSLSEHVNDTVTVSISVLHGGVLLSHARSELTFEGTSAVANEMPSEFAARVRVSGPMWAMVAALKGMLYKTDLNWNSWIVSGINQLQPVISEVSKRDTLLLVLVPLL